MVTVLETVRPPSLLSPLPRSPLPSLREAFYRSRLAHAWSTPCPDSSVMVLFTNSSRGRIHLSSTERYLIAGLTQTFHRNKKKSHSRQRQPPSQACSVLSLQKASYIPKRSSEFAPSHVIIVAAPLCQVFRQCRRGLKATGGGGERVEGSAKAPKSGDIGSRGRKRC